MKLEQVNRILLIEDEPLTADITARKLRAYGVAQVDVCSNGHKAMSWLGNEQLPYPDLILTDLHMPGMDGLEFLRFLAGINNHIPIVLLSGTHESLLESATQVARERELNVLGALGKPLHREALEALLATNCPDLQANRSDAPLLGADDIRDGLEAGAIDLCYQPQVSVQSGRVEGVEALARWLHPTLGAVTPEHFVPVAEHHGLIDELTTTLARRGLKQLHQWHDQGQRIRLSLNFSAQSLPDLSLPEVLAGLVKQERLEPSHLIVEVTESHLAKDFTNALEVLARLRLHGFGLAIDDFGTGYASMQQLKRCPFTELKIDKEFVTGANTDRSSYAILESSVALAKKLKLEIVAEGVEKQEDWDLVERLGCDRVQGYWVSKALSADEMSVFLQRRH